VLIFPRSIQSCGASALKVQTGQKPPFVRKRSDAGQEQIIWGATEVPHGHNGVVDRFRAEGAACSVALTLSEEHRNT
jgi:hypothetical protein